MKRFSVFLTSSVLAVLLWLVFAGGLALADPLNAELRLQVSRPAVTVGESFQLTITLVTMDAADAFSDWNVKLDYNEAAFQIDDVWLNESVLPPTFDAQVVYYAGGIVKVADLTFFGDSGDNDPWDLAVITFTAIAPGSTDFAYVTASLPNDTSFYRVSDGQRWLPGILSRAQVDAGDFLWNGSASSDWDIPANWNPVNVPGATDAVVIPGGLATYPVLNTNASVYSLTIAPGAALNIPDTFALTAESVSNYGDLVITRNVPDATLTPFHLYDSGVGVSYFGAEITANGAMNATRVAIRGHQECTSVDEPGDTVDRCFDITPGQVPTDATVAFYYLDTELDGQNPSTMQVWHWNSGAMTWTVAGGATPGGSVPDYYVSVTDITDFSPFALKSGVDQPTAVHLQGFVAFGGLGGVALVAVGLAIVYPRHKRKSGR